MPGGRGTLAASETSGNSTLFSGDGGGGASGASSY